MYTGELTPFQLILTYVAMLLIPFSMMGLLSLNYLKGSFLFLLGTTFIAISYIYFSGTAIYAYVESISNYDVLIRRLGFTYLLHGILLVVGGLLFCISAFRQSLFSRWTISLILIGSVLSLVTGSFKLSEDFYVIANFSRNIGFLFIGVSLLKRPLVFG